jgi:hypothetical protein
MVPSVEAVGRVITAIILVAQAIPIRTLTNKAASVAVVVVGII